MKKQPRVYPKPGAYKKLDKNTYDIIANLYKSGQYTTEQIAKRFEIAPRTVQRIAKRTGVLRSLSESNKLVAPLKHYYKKPEHLKVKRKQLPNKLRYKMITEQPYCLTCGSTVAEGIRLEIDHIDNNPSNNDPSNLQVLCNLCNRGKAL